MYVCALLLYALPTHTLWSNFYPYCKCVNVTEVNSECSVILDSMQFGSELLCKVKCVVLDLTISCLLVLVVSELSSSVIITS